MQYIHYASICSVRMLTETIEKVTCIPKEHQVLLISGGEILQIDAKVFSYSAGTDTNPIFLFSTYNLVTPPVAAVYREGKHTY